MTSYLLDAATIETLLDELNDELVAWDVLGELYIVGGAAMTLTYAHRSATDDIDGLFGPEETIYDAMDEVARRHRLDPGWLNNQVAVSRYLPDGVPGGDLEAIVLREPVDASSGLRILIASPRYLLAMKLLAARDIRDQDDVNILVRSMGLTSVDQAREVFEDLYLGREMGRNAEAMVRHALQTKSPVVALGSRVVPAGRWSRCGATTSAGNPCSRLVRPGTKCWQHRW
ncbi:MAG: hypothetical protein U0904_07285 [Candidatus Nanopelagicales bacterium]|nr:hypothetical protein [Candidatus Nanopelagicales bacterium]